MKNGRVFIPIFILVAIIVLLFAMLILKSLFSQPLSTEKSQDNTPVSNQNIYFQGATSAPASVPSKTVIDSQNPRISLYWVQQSIVGGNDTCTLYDSSTNQIYATSYRTNGNFSGRDSGWMYYSNNIIKPDPAKALLDKACFKL